MVMSLAEYELQVRIVKQTIRILEGKIESLQQQLKVDPSDTMLKRDLRELTMDMTITKNELQQIESAIDEYYSQNAS